MRRRRENPLMRYALLPEVRSLDPRDMLARQLFVSAKH